jgi:hypothetical protein
VGELLCWIGSSKDKLKNAESLQGMRSMRKTKPFGSKPPRVGKSSFERSNKLLKHDRNIGTDDQGSVFAGFTASGEMALRKFVKN